MSSPLAASPAAPPATPRAESPAQWFASVLHDPLGELITDPDSALQRGAAKAQEAISKITGNDFEKTGEAATGDKPSAEELRDAKLDMPGEPDMEQARKDAEKTLESIDFSKPNIALWVPGTNSHDVQPEWRKAVEESFTPGSVSINAVDYPATNEFNDSAATGMETLRLVLAGIAERGGDQKVTVSGHSQGAWVIGDAINTPELGRMVDRAVLYGVPGTASVDWSGGGGGKVRVVNDPNDAVTLRVTGDNEARKAVDELTAGKTADGKPLSPKEYIERGGAALWGAIQNPGLAASLLGEMADPEAWKNGAHPHNYDEYFHDGARFIAN